MTALPDSVIKHDGRNVAFDPRKLEDSACAAISDADVEISPNAARSLAGEARRIVCERIVAQDKFAVPTADLRAVTAEVLREFSPAVADAYAAHARSAAQLLWRVRVIEPFMSREDGGAPWDRRRLVRSLSGSGVPADAAGATAREVERQLVALRRAHVTPALIHSLAALALKPGEHGARTYAARRIGYSALERESGDSAEGIPAPRRLAPSGSVALEQFWLQCVHSPAVTAAVRGNLLSLAPFASGPDSHPRSSHSDENLDPLSQSFPADLKDMFARHASGMLLANSPERRSAFGAFLSEFGADPKPVRLSALRLKIQPESSSPFPRRGEWATPVTLNSGALVVREGLRDSTSVSVRLSELVVVAMAALRERERYWGNSPVNGRVLPIALAGLWNAAAWLRGRAFDTPYIHGGGEHITRGIVETLRELCGELKRFIQAAAESSGMRVVLTIEAPHSAAESLWAEDVEFFRRDGVRLRPEGHYAGAHSIHIRAGAPDFVNRLDAAAELAAGSDCGSCVHFRVPHPKPPERLPWTEFLAGLGRFPFDTVYLSFGGPQKNLKVLLREFTKYEEGYPLLEAALGSGGEENLFDQWSHNRMKRLEQALS